MLSPEPRWRAFRFALKTFKFLVVNRIKVNPPKNFVNFVEFFYFVRTNRSRSLQGYLAFKKTPSPGTPQEAYDEVPKVVLGVGAFSYE